MSENLVQAARLLEPLVLHLLVGANSLLFFSILIQVQDAPWALNFQRRPSPNTHHMPQLSHVVPKVFHCMFEYCQVIGPSTGEGAMDPNNASGINTKRDFVSKARIFKLVAKECLTLLRYSKVCPIDSYQCIVPDIIDQAGLPNNLLD
jgi:hypothetical protein